MKHQFLISDYLSGLFFNIEGIPNQAARCYWTKKTALEQVNGILSARIAVMVQSNMTKFFLRVRRCLYPNVKLATSRITRQD